MPEFYMIIARKTLFPNFEGTRASLPLPVSYAKAYAMLRALSTTTKSHCRHVNVKITLLLSCPKLAEVYDSSATSYRQVGDEKKSQTCRRPARSASVEVRL